MDIAKGSNIQSTRTSNRTTSPEKDLEQSVVTNNHFINDTVLSISWDELTVAVEDRTTKDSTIILDSASGYVESGQVLALMGPSGCGKTTMLNVLAHRPHPKAKVTGTIRVNGQTASTAKMSQIARYVEQEDALIGSLTVRETIKFSAQLALPSSITKSERIRRVDDALRSFGIEAQANSLIGTPIRKGISGGQKRRVSVASQLVTSPKILFLDEPTSGLDSAASREVMSYISSIAKELRLIVILSIHQPSTTTFNLLDHVLFLSAGETCFFGPRQKIEQYFAQIGHPIPLHTNPAEFLLDLINIDFAIDTNTARAQLDDIHHRWLESDDARNLRTHVLGLEQNSAGSSLQIEASSKPSVFSQTFTLLQRSFIKSYRDVVAYQIRIGMYLGLAIMMGTVWLRLPYTQTSIQTFINAIFFGGAFMSFMAVAYIPAYIEDLHTFHKERANGLYGPLPFVLANFLIGVPYLFLITILFSVVSYWLVNLRPSAGGFWLWVLYLFLDLLAAEGLVVLISSLMPIFVVALAITAFANGLWMCVGGFLVPPGTLNVFWKYVFHYIDYQAWVQQALIINQFKTTIYDCSSDGRNGWQCMYASDLASQGKIRGTAVIESFKYGYEGSENGKIIGIMIGIIVAYRLFGYLALVVVR